MAGGAFFQIDRSHLHADDWNVRIERVTFEENQARRAGGGFFIDKIKALHPDYKGCNLTHPAPFPNDQATHISSVNCRSMKSNSVGESGYGANIATPASSCITRCYCFGGERAYDMHSIIHFSNWRSGHVLPTFRFVMVDQLGQGPAAKKPHTDAHAKHQLLQYDDVVELNIHDPEYVIDDLSSSDLLNGTGSTTVTPVQRPGYHSLTFKLKGEQHPILAVRLTISQCRVNEEAIENGTRCRACDTNQFNFDPEKGSCQRCSPNADCSSPYILPNPGYWNALPCSNRIQKCISFDACLPERQIPDSNSTKEKMVAHYDIDHLCVAAGRYLNWSDAVMCAEGYTGPICGSCRASWGRVGKFTCAECPVSGKGAVIHLVVVLFCSVVLIMSIVVLQIKQNLASAKHWTRRQIGKALAHRSQLRLNFTGYHITSKGPAPAPNHSGGVAGGIRSTNTKESYKEKADIEKAKFMELLKVCDPHLSTVRDAL